VSLERILVLLSRQDSSWPITLQKGQKRNSQPLSTFHLINARGNTSETLSEKVSKRNFYGVEGTAYTPIALPPTLSTPPRPSLSSPQNFSLFLPPGDTSKSARLPLRRYKSPRRHHPPPRANRVSHHPPQCYAQQTGVQEIVMEALLVAIYSTRVAS
jgi:hypothetical protein